MKFFEATYQILYSVNADGRRSRVPVPKDKQTTTIYAARTLLEAIPLAEDVGPQKKLLRVKEVPK